MINFLKNAGAICAAAGLVYLGLRWARKKLDDSLLADMAQPQPDKTPAAEPAAADASQPAAEPNSVQPAAQSAPDAQDRPNANPVDSAPSGRVCDPLQIASPEDFQDWDHLGCQG